MTNSGDAVVTSFADGALRYTFYANAEVESGDYIEVYAGDYFIGRATILSSQIKEFPLTASLSIEKIPLIDFPIELRCMLDRTQAEIGPPVTIPNRTELFTLAGLPRVTAILVSLQDRFLGFELKIETLPEYAREFVLYLNKDEVSRSISRPIIDAGHNKSATHEIIFEITLIVREGTHIEISDAVTGAEIYEHAATWMNMIGPVLNALKRLNDRYDELLASFKYTQTRLDTISNISRDRQIMDRLDMFYRLINDRIDREVKWLVSHIDPKPESGPPRAVTSTKGHYQKTASDISGVGFYEIETNGVDSWRWFGPHVTLLLNDVTPDSRGLFLTFAATAQGVDINAVKGSINGLPLFLDAQTPGGGKYVLSMPIPLGSIGSDNTIILNLEFSQSHRSSSDRRALCAVFSRLEIQAG